MDLSKLPQLDGWIGDEFDPRTFLLSSVSVAEVAAVSLLFWPEFVEYRDCVFLKFAYNRTAIDTWFDELKEDGHAVESVVNHLHLWDVFAADTPAENAVLAELASRIGKMWSSALAESFPDREFIVTATDDPNDYGPTLSVRSV
jgi:hypothetical protein